MAKFVKAFTYEPKVNGVWHGKIRQTIRKAKGVQAGDEILFHTWEDKPYRSKWDKRMEVIVTEVIPITISEEGIKQGERFYDWDSAWANKLARLDGIKPATGQELKRLFSLPRFHGNDWEGDYEVIRW